MRRVDADGIGGDAAVLVGRKVVRRDRRRRGRIGRAQAQPAAAGRLEVADARGESGKPVQRLAEAVERQRLHVELDVGAVVLGIGAR